MSFVTKHQQAPLPTTMPDQAAGAALPPIAPPYVRIVHYGDPAFETPQSQPKQSDLNPFPGRKHDDDEFRVDL